MFLKESGNRYDAGKITKCNTVSTTYVLFRQSAFERNGSKPCAWQFLNTFQYALTLCKLAFHELKNLRFVKSVSCFETIGKSLWFRQNRINNGVEARR